MLYAAAGEVARMWGTEEVTPFRSTKLFAPPPKPIKKTNPVTGYHPNHAQTEAHLAYLQLQATHVSIFPLKSSFISSLPCPSPILIVLSSVSADEAAAADDEKWRLGPGED